MARRKHTAEQIINKLREAEVTISAGSTVAEASRQIGVTQQTFYRWRTEYVGLRIDQARRLKRLENENGRLRRAVAQGAVGMLMVVLVVPLLREHLHLPEGIEDLLDREVVPELAVEALNIPIFPRATRCDEENLGSHPLEPQPHRPGCELWSVIRAEVLRYAP